MAPVTIPNPIVTQMAVLNCIQYSMIRQMCFRWFCKINLREWIGSVDVLLGVGYTFTVDFTLKADND